MSRSAPMDNAAELRLRRLPDQLTRARARVAQLEEQARRHGLRWLFDDAR